MLYNIQTTLVVIIGVVITNYCPNIQSASVDQEDNNNYHHNHGEPLYLSPLIQQGKIEEAQKLAQVHDEDFLNVTSYAGFFNVNETYNSQMFFWYFPSESSADSPLILWLEGGPGIPSSYGLFFGNGPFELINNTITKRDLSWSKHYHMLYIDNPIGVGYSLTNSTDGYTYTQTEFAENLYLTLKQFLMMFPELQDNELYPIGESYGAKYAITLCETIKRHNQNATFKINLQGFGLFSGFFDPINQIDHGDSLYNLGLIDEHGRAELAERTRHVKELINSEKWTEATAQRVNMVNSILNEIGFLGYFNILKPDNNILKEVFANVVAINMYMHSKANALHLGYMCDIIGFHPSLMIEDIMKSEATKLSSILETYRGVVVTGQLDIIVSYTSVHNALSKMNFSSSEEWQTAKRQLWYMNSTLAGYYKVAGNLTEILVLNSGHTIPVDQPERALDVLKRLTSNEWK